jgi:hypothetical protein
LQDTALNFLNVPRKSMLELDGADAVDLAEIGTGHLLRYNNEIAAAHHALTSNGKTCKILARTGLRR